MVLFNNIYSGREVNILDESVLQEVYFGEEPIRPIQNQLSMFRKKWYGKSYVPKINYDPELIKMNRLIENIFGYKRFSMIIDPNNTMNAYMLDIGVFTLDQKEVYDLSSKKLKVVQNGKGFRYAPGSEVNAIGALNFGLIANPVYTDREIVGIMLHEIGHSFQYSVLDYNGLMGKATSFLSVLKHISKKANKNIENDRDFSDSKISEDIEDSRNFISKIFSNIRSKQISVKSAIHSVADTVSRMKNNLKMKSYTDEKFADTFASMYGYGADVQAALDKAQKEAIKFYFADGKQKVPGTLSTIIKVAMLTFNSSLEIMLGIKEEHPEGLTRIKVQIQFIEKELKNTALDPKMKSALESQLVELKGLIDDYLSHADDEDAFKAYRKYYIKMYEKYNGDMREKKADNDALFDVIDSRYKEVSNR